MHLLVPRPLVSFAVDQLAHVDYAVANRVTEAVAHGVRAAYDHDAPGVAAVLVRVLERFDDFGSTLIAVVVWLASHAA